MRIALVHPSYYASHSEIAPNWTPAWAAYLAGSLRTAGYDDVHSIDPMTNYLSDEDLRDQLSELAPDVVGCTAIAPSIHTAERVLEVAEQTCPGAIRVLGGIYAAVMYQQVLHEAPWIDVIVRGKDEWIFTGLIEAIDEGRWPAERESIRGVAFRTGDRIVATRATQPAEDLRAIKPDWSLLQRRFATNAVIRKACGYQMAS